MVKVHTEFTSDPAKVERDLQRLNERYVALQDRMKQTTNTSKSGADSTVVALGKIAAGVGITTKAYEILTDAIKANEQAQRDAAESTKTSESGFRQLQQLADVNKPGDFARLKGEAQQFFAAGGGATQDDAARTLFSLISAGAGDKQNRALFANLSSSGLVEDVAETAASSKALQSALGEAETGSFEDIVSKALAASAGSPSTADQILAGASRAGGAARSVGLSDEELLTATAVVANITKSADVAGTQVKALAQSASKIPDLEGQNLLGIVQNIESRNLGRADLIKLLRTDEAIAGYDALSANQGSYTELLGSVSTAAGDQLAARKAALADTDPALAAARAQRIAANQRIIAEESLGVGTNTADALQDALITQLRTEGASGGEVYIKDKILSAKRFAERNAPEFLGGGGEQGFVEDFLPFADETTQQRIGNIEAQGGATAVREQSAKLLAETNRQLREQTELMKKRRPVTQPAGSEN